MNDKGLKNNYTQFNIQRRVVLQPKEEQPWVTLLLTSGGKIFRMMNT